MGINRFSQEEAKALSDRYQKGESSTTIAQHLGASPTTIRKAIVDNGVSIRSPSDCHRKYVFDGAFFSRIDSEKKAYWLGFITADGCLYVKEDIRRYSLSVTLAERDINHLEAFRRDLGSDLPIRRVRPGGYSGSTACVNLTLHSESLYRDLVRLGLEPRKSLTARPWNGSEKLLPHYWRGVLDGDGWLICAKKGRQVVGLTGSRAIVDAFAEHVRKSTGKRAAIRANGSVWRVTFHERNVCLAILGVLYADATISLDRKRRLAEAILARPEHARRTWLHLTGETLEALRRDHGSWRGVCRALNLNRGNFLTLRKRIAHRELPVFGAEIRP